MAGDRFMCYVNYLGRTSSFGKRLTQTHHNQICYHLPAPSTADAARIRRVTRATDIVFLAPIPENRFDTVIALGQVRNVL